MILLYVAAIVLFITGIIVHELVHYLVAKHYGGNPKFVWSPKGTIKIFGGNPGVRYCDDDITTTKSNIISLAPIPVTFLFDTLALLSVSLVWFDYTTAETYKTISIILLCMLFGFIATLAGSSTDIKDVIKRNKHEREKHHG